MLPSSFDMHHGRLVFDVNPSQRFRSETEIRCKTTRISCSGQWLTLAICFFRRLPPASDVHTTDQRISSTNRSKLDDSLGSLLSSIHFPTLLILVLVLWLSPPSSRCLGIVSTHRLPPRSTPIFQPSALSTATAVSSQRDTFQVIYHIGLPIYHDRLQIRSPDTLRPITITNITSIDTIAANARQNVLTSLLTAHPHLFAHGRKATWMSLSRLR